MAKFKPLYRAGCVINEKAHKGVGGAVNATWGQIKKGERENVYIKMDFLDNRYYYLDLVDLYGWMQERKL